MFPTRRPIRAAPGAPNVEFRTLRAARFDPSESAARRFAVFSRLFRSVDGENVKKRAVLKIALDRARSFLKIE